MINFLFGSKSDVPEGNSDEKKQSIPAEKENDNYPGINETLLSSLPYPAMYVRRKDKVIIAANRIAQEYGARKGGHCWREFGGNEFITEENKKISGQFRNIVSEDYNIKCTFCRGDECIFESPLQNIPELKAFNKIWDTYWIKVSEDVFLHYLIDITERKKLEESLKQSELFLKQTQQVAQIGTYSLDIITGIWTCSDISENIFGIDKNFGKTIDNWISLVHPQMRELMSGYYFSEVIGKGKRFEKEYKIIRPIDGKECWIQGIGDLQLNDNNEPVKMIGVIRDVTERKEEHSRLLRNLKFTEALLKAVPVPVFFLNSNGEYSGCNEALTLQLGISEENLKGKTVKDIWPGNESKIYYENDLEIIKTQQFQTEESKVLDKDKNIRDVILAKNIFYDDEGNVAGLVGSYIDITDHKLIEEALRSSEQMLQTVLDHFPGVVFWKDIHSVYMGCNQAFAEGAGLNNPSEIVGKTDFDLPWKDTEAEKYRADDRDVIEKEKKKLHIIEKQHQAGNKVIWFDTSKIPLREHGGKVIGVIGISGDINERKAHEEEKSFLLACIENTSDQVVVKDLNLRVVAANKSWLQSIGENSIAGVIGKSFSEVYNEDAKEEPLSSYIDDELKAQKLNQGEFIVKEYPLKFHDGKEIIALVKRYPVFDDNKELIGTGTIFSDITEYKKVLNALSESERRYKLLSENITDGIFTCRNGIIEYVNKSMTQIFECENSDMEGKLLTDLIIPERRSDFEKYVIFESSVDQINSVEIECVKKDNSKIFVEIFMNYIAIEGMIYGVIHDITQKRRIQERKIIKTIIQTEEREKASFSKELHDGLGPLLSTIKLYLQWSLRPKSNKSYKEIIKKAEDVLEEALTTVREISNKLSPHLLINYGLTSAVQSFANKLQETNKIKKISVESNLSRRLEMEIEVALYRAIIECVNNTIKHAGAGNIFIKISDNQTQIQLRYMDDGKGFDIVKTMQDNKGLGLFNLQNRIKTIGGEIMMFSNPREGVNYNITVPVKKSYEQLINKDLNK